MTRKRLERAMPNAEAIEVARSNEQRYRIHLTLLAQDPNYTNAKIVLSTDGNIKNELARVQSGSAAIISGKYDHLGIARAFDLDRDGMLPYIPTEKRYDLRDRLSELLINGEAYAVAERVKGGENWHKRERRLTFEPYEIPHEYFDALSELPARTQLATLVEQGYTIIVQYRSGKFAEIRPYLDEFDAQLPSIPPNRLRDPRAWPGVRRGAKVISYKKPGSNQGSARMTVQHLPEDQIEFYWVKAY